LRHTRFAQKAGFQHTSPWYLGNNTSSGWYGNYTPYEREKFSPETYWLHHVLFFYKTLRLAPGPTQLSVEWVPAVLFPSVKRPWREVNLAEAATKVKNDWFRNCAFPTCLHGVGGNKLNIQYRTNFTVQLCEGDIIY